MFHECAAQADLDDGTDATVTARCDLPYGHDGDHHDTELGLEWPVMEDEQWGSAL